MNVIEMLVSSAATALVVAVIVAMALRIHYQRSAQKQIEAMQSLVIKICASNEKALNALQYALMTHQKLNEVLQKEKELLEKQLELATDAIDDITEEDDDEEDHVVETKQQATVEDKLHTIRALLNDSVKNNTTVNADSLLSIVNCKLPE